MIETKTDTPEYARLTALILFGLLAVRVACNLLSPLELYADEAQYWRWGQSLEWGYYSKPPLIAWLIHASTGLFGDSAWAIRLPAPFLHTIAAWCLFLLGRSIAGPRAGLMASVGYALMPAVWLSSVVLSTDGVLMPIWAFALFLLWRVREGQAGWLGYIALGLAVGSGFLAKYAMLYFAIGIILAILLDAPTRRHLLNAKGAAALIFMAGVMAPHLVWNAQNDFATVGHTVDNANLGGDLIHPENILTFLTDQMGVFGPVSFLALIGGLIFLRGSPDAETRRRELWLICFIVPVLVIILVQAVLSRAHANWAATAYPAASVLIAIFFLRARANRVFWYVIAALSAIAIFFAPDFTLLTRLLIGLGVAGAIMFAALISKFRPEGLFWTGLTLHGLLGAIMTIVLIVPQSLAAPLGLENALKRTRGWENISTQLADFINETGQPSALLVDEREVWHELDFYLADRLDSPLILWRFNETPHSFAESRDLTPDIDGDVLIASLKPDLRLPMQADFETFEKVGAIRVNLGTRSNGCPIIREFILYRASGYEQLPRTQAWLDRFDDRSMDAPKPCPPAK